MWAHTIQTSVCAQRDTSPAMYASHESHPFDVHSTLLPYFSALQQGPTCIECFFPLQLWHPTYMVTNLPHIHMLSRLHTAFSNSSDIDDNVDGRALLSPHDMKQPIGGCHPYARFFILLTPNRADVAGCSFVQLAEHITVLRAW